MITVFFEDDGQDFLEWDINDKGEVVDCRPFQGDIWIGTMVHNKDIKPGDRLDVTLTGGTRTHILHAVAKVRQPVLKIHLRDAQLRTTAIHFLVGLPESQLTDEPSQVTCKRCLKMIKASEDKEGKSK